MPITRANWTFALVRGASRVDLINDPTIGGWTLAEGGGGDFAGALDVQFGSVTSGSAPRTSSTRKNAKITLTCRLLNQAGYATLQRNIRAVQRFIVDTLMHWENGERDPIYLVRRHDEGFSGTGSQVVLFGRGELYHDVLSIDDVSFPESLNVMLVPTTSLNILNAKLSLTCEPWGKGKPTFLAEATGWVRFDGDDGSLNVWRGVTNLCVNPSFEHATYDTGWTLAGAGATKAVEYERVRTGFQAIKVATTGADGQLYWSQATTLGTLYCSSIYAYWNGTDPNGVTCYLYASGDAASLSYSEADSQHPGWYRLSLVWVATAATTNIFIVTSAGYVMYYDDFQLEAMPSAYATLLTNGGFETAGGGGADVFDTWTETAGDGAIASEATLFHTGAKAAKLTAGATRNTKLAQTIAVVGGKDYTLLGYTRGDGTRYGRYLVYDVTNSANIATGNAGAGLASYVSFTVNFTAPATCTSVRLDLMCSNTNGGICYFDSIVLYRMPAAVENAASPFTVEGYQLGPGVAWSGTEHNSTTVRTQGQWRVRTLWQPHPGYEVMFCAKGALSCWVKTPWPGTDPITHYIAGSGATPGSVNDIAVYKSSTGYLYVQMYGSTAAGYKTRYGSVTATWTSNTWHHILVTWDTTGPTSLYFDGVALATTGTSGTWTPLSALGSYVYVGTDGAGANPFDGQISDLRIFGPDAAITVASLYAAGRGKSELAYIWTQTMGGHLDGTLDTAPRDNQFWVANVPGDEEAPLRLMLHGNSGSDVSQMYLALHKGNTFPYRLDILESAGAYKESTATSLTADAARSGGSSQLLAMTSAIPWLTFHWLMTDPRQGWFVANRYRVLAVVKDESAATGNIKMTGNVAQNCSAALTSLQLFTKHASSPLPPYAYTTTVSAWEVVDLGIVDIPLARAPQNAPGQERQGLASTTSYLSWMFAAYATSASSYNFSVDYWMFMPAQTCVYAGTVGNGKVLVLDGIGNRTWTSNAISSDVAQEVSDSLNVTGVLPSAPTNRWTFGNVINGATPASNLHLYGIYQPRFLWGR
jgi:hypothetical protein